eukprot:3567824-Pleurochrysis_carterae.AAC.1
MRLLRGVFLDNLKIDRCERVVVEPELSRMRCIAEKLKIAESIQVVRYTKLVLHTLLAFNVLVFVTGDREM